MTVLIPAPFDRAVEVIVGTRRIMVAVNPRLLADTLVRALARPDVEVVLDPEDDRAGTYDLAVVSSALPPAITAEVVVTLPDPAAGTQGSITTVEGTEPAVLGDLASLLEALNRFLRPG